MLQSRLNHVAILHVHMYIYSNLTDVLNIDEFILIKIQKSVLYLHCPKNKNFVLYPLLLIIVFLNYYS